MALTQNQHLIFLVQPYDHLATATESFLLDRKTANLTPKSIEFYALQLKRFAKFCESQAITKIEQITPDTIRQFLLWLENTGHNAGGRHGSFRVLRAFFYWLENENDGYIAPIRKVRPPKVDVQPIEGVKTEELKALLDTCKGDRFTDKRDKALFLFLADTGMRISECLNLQWSDIDLVTGQVLIRKSKNRKPRTVFISKTTRQALRIYRKLNDSQFVWLNTRGERLTQAAVRDLLVDRSTKAGLSEVPSPHDFRRFAAITMLRNGADVVSVSRLLGHSTLEVTKRYLAQTEQDLRAVHDLFSPLKNLK